MNTTVNKIGGKNMSQLDQVGQLTDGLGRRQERVVYVVSAFEDVTNSLTTGMDQLNGTDYSQEDIRAAFHATSHIHQGIVEKFFHGEHRVKAQEDYQVGFDLMMQALLSHKDVSCVLMPISESFQIRDQVIGFGERIAGSFLQMYLTQQGKEAHYFDGVSVDRGVFETGLVTDRRIHEAKRSGISQALRQQPVVFGADGGIRIFGGHMLGTPKGLVPHQGRGYSDIMGVDTSLALSDLGERVTATRFWKDVDGVYTANPKDLHGNEGLVLHRDISNAEALECASAGSGLINISALSLAQQHNLDLQIRNIQRLDPNYGTNVITGDVMTRHLFKVIASNPHVDALTITLPEMADRSGFGAAIMSLFAMYDISVDQIGTEGTSMTFSIPLPQDHADRESYRDRIRQCMMDLKVIEVKGERFTVQDIQWGKEKFSTVSVIGRELRDRVGILGSITTLFGAFGINVYMPSQGIPQTRLTFLIDHHYRQKAVQLLHDVYVTNNTVVREIFERRRLELDASIMGTFLRK